MLASFLKFVAFTLAPALVMIWTTSPDVWSCVSYKFHHVGSNPSKFVHMFGDLLGQAQDTLFTSENVVRRLNCNNFELSVLEPVPSMAQSLAPPISLPQRFRLLRSKRKFHVKSLPPLALDRSIFLRCTKKSPQKPAKPLNYLEDLAHKVEERFVLAYPSQAANKDVENSVPT
ncbi:hypothetical protein DSO57_1039550 [Entomophthora muscae]|uniref:Uncharacterized protein n=1 Tax=Entomophthora muscae TaxID=34485 RepID=A0ACC2TX37_9FUNG|nr:hypothetical protein DSO57_1039550 [Entomophthora muscae]